MRSALHEVGLALAASTNPIVQRTHEVVRELLDAGEPGVALEFLVRNLYEDDITVLPSTKNSLLDAAELTHTSVEHIEALTTHPGTSASEWEFPDRWWLGWRGSVIRDVAATDESATAAIGTSGRLTVVGAVLLAASAGAQAGEPVGPSQALSQVADRVVLSTVVFKSGHLRVIVDTGTMINVPPDPNRTSWSATTDSGRVINSVAGGGITFQ